MTQPATHRYEKPDRFVTGLVGELGHRVYYVQARQGSRITNVVCRRSQLADFSDHIEQVLNELTARQLIEQVPISPEPLDLKPLDVPLEGDFVAGALGINWQPQTNVIQLEFYEIGRFDNGDKLVANLSVSQAREFIARSRMMIALKSPICPFCSQPLHACGHICPSSDGFRRPMIFI